MNTKSIVSIIVLVVGIINLILSSLGLSPLEITGETVNAIVTGVVTVGGAAGTAWYNLSATPAAQLCQTLLNNIKAGNVDFNEASKMITELVSGVKDVARGTD